MNSVREGRSAVHNSQGEEDNTGKGVAKDELPDSPSNQQKKPQIHENPRHYQLCGLINFVIAPYPLLALVPPPLPPAPPQPIRSIVAVTSQKRKPANATGVGLAKVFRN